MIAPTPVAVDGVLLCDDDGGPVDRDRAAALMTIAAAALAAAGDATVVRWDGVWTSATLTTSPPIRVHAAAVPDGTDRETALAHLAEAAEAALTGLRNLKRASDRALCLDPGDWALDHATRTGGETVEIAARTPWTPGRLDEPVFLVVAVDEGRAIDLSMEAPTYHVGPDTDRDPAADPLRTMRAVAAVDAWRAARP